MLAPNFDFVLTNKRTTFKLESKADLKRRGVESPDLADGLALTYYSKVHSPVGYMQQIPFEQRMILGQTGRIRGGTGAEEWDPFA